MEDLEGIDDLGIAKGPPLVSLNTRLWPALPVFL